MRINTNVSAINAANNLSRVQDAASESMSKLSSGFRINKAADDAAGLGIANKFRADTRALTQASRNTEQANSLLQVAEGSVTTVQKMLERMKELAVQAGSDTVDSAGRGRINSEFKALRAEVQRTIDTTTFQGAKLLDGSYGKSVAVATGGAAGTLTTVSGAPSAANDVQVVLDPSKIKASSTYTLTVTAGAGTTATAALTDGTSTQTLSYTSASAATTAANATSLNFSAFGVTLNTQAGSTGLASGTIKTAAPAGNGGTFLIGATDGQSGSGGSNLLNVSLANLSVTAANASSGLKLGDGSASATADIDLSANGGADARAAITNIDAAIATVSSALGDIGAAQNRISYAADNIKTTISNFSAAESVIRDVDMADEMTKFSKNNILAQAGTAMLAQANQAGQSVLKLLQG